MTVEQIKERISVYYLGNLTSYFGYKFIESNNPDYGVDATVSIIKKYQTPSGRNAYVEIGKDVHIQLKCTTEKSIRRTSNGIKFRINVKTYNNLVERRQLYSKEVATPFILIVVVLSEEEEEWVSLNLNNFESNYGQNTKGLAYYFWPKISDIKSSNSSSQTILIPKENIVSFNFLKKMPLILKR